MSTEAESDASSDSGSTEFCKVVKSSDSFERELKAALGLINGTPLPTRKQPPSALQMSQTSAAHNSLNPSSQKRLGLMRSITKTIMQTQNALKWLTFQKPPSSGLIDDVLAKVKEDLSVHSTETPTDTATETLLESHEFNSKLSLLSSDSSSTRDGVEQEEKSPPTNTQKELLDISCSSTFSRLDSEFNCPLVATPDDEDDGYSSSISRKERGEKEGMKDEETSIISNVSPG